MVQQLEQLYREHCPEKMANVPVLLERYQGREHELLEKARAKYGL